MVTARLAKLSLLLWTTTVDTTDIRFPEPISFWTEYNPRKDTNVSQPGKAKREGPRQIRFDWLGRHLKITSKSLKNVVPHLY